MKPIVPLLLLAVTGACSTSRDYDPAPSVQPGAYRATGSNPAWELTVDRSNLVYTDFSNRVRVAEQAPRSTAVAAGLPGRPKIGWALIVPKRTGLPGLIATFQNLRVKPSLPSVSCT